MAGMDISATAKRGRGRPAAEHQLHPLVQEVIRASLSPEEHTTNRAQVHEILAAMKNYAVTLRKMGDFESALTLSTETLARSQRLFQGPDHPDVTSRRAR
jgi:hypothetical protein